jgi:hypothetical protein
VSGAPGRLNTRAFVAMVIGLSGLGLPLTGVANHIHGFSELTVERHAWMSAHNALGLVFVTFSVWHAALNWRPLWKYIRTAAARIPPVSREAALAGLLLALLLAVSVGHAFRGGR